MTPADWRQLVDAYLGGRLSADTFRRRFSEAFDACVAARIGVPRAIQQLYFTVDAYGGDPMGRGHDVTDDADLIAAAKAAMRELAGEPALEADPRVSEAERVEAAKTTERRSRRAVYTLGAIGFAGCLVALAWVAVVALQFFAASAQVQSLTNWGPGPSAVAGLVLAVIPIVGSVTAFFGAMDVWNWPWWGAALVFFAFPALTYAGAIQRWRTLR